MFGEISSMRRAKKMTILGEWIEVGFETSEYLGGNKQCTLCNSWQNVLFQCENDDEEFLCSSCYDRIELIASGVIK